MCGTHPEGSCLDGDRCGRGGLWHKDSSCAMTINRQPDQADHKAGAGQGVGSAAIFDRWGIHKTKASCESAGGGWIRSEGKTSCKPGMDKAKKP